MLRTCQPAVAGLFVTCLFLMLLASACQRQPEVSQTAEGQLVLGETEQTDTLRRTTTLGARTLVLDGFNGRIWLEGVVDTPTAQLTFIRRVRGSGKAATERLNKISLEEAGDDEVYQYVLRGEERGTTSIDIVGTVPRGTPVRIRLESGTVALSALAGPLGVEVENGSVTIAGAEQDVDVQASNGDLDVALAGVPTDASVRLRTANGTVRLTVPGQVGARVEARTGAGTINADGLSFARRSLEPRGAGATFEGVLGRGGSTLTLRTENGSVYLGEGIVYTLPTPDWVSETGGEPAPEEGPARNTMPVAEPDTTLRLDA